MKTFLTTLVLVVIIVFCSKTQAEVTIGESATGSDGKQWRLVTFILDLRTATLNLMDQDWQRKTTVAADGRVKIAGSIPDKTAIYLAGQPHGKPDGAKDVVSVKDRVGLSWDRSSFQPATFQNGVYTVSIYLQVGESYDYKFVAWDGVNLYPTFTRDPNNPEVQKQYGNSIITIP